MGLSESDFLEAMTVGSGSGFGPRSAGSGERSGGRSKGLSELDIVDLEVGVLVSRGFVVGVAFLGIGDEAACKAGFCNFE